MTNRQTTSAPRSLATGDSCAWVYPIPPDAPTGLVTDYIVRLVFSSVSVTGTYDELSNTINFFLPPSDTIDLKKGRDYWRISATKKDQTERITLDRGEIRIISQYADSSGDNPTDPRSHAAKMVDMIEATLENRASSSVAEYQINGRALKYMQPSELLKLLRYYKVELAREKAADQIAKGRANPGRILVRWG